MLEPLVEINPPFAELVSHDFRDGAPFFTMRSGIPPPSSGRAGEAGRGFALVALEMRRLAERVTATVATAHALMADIDAANLATVEATRQSRELAEGTVSTARDINLVTTQQSAESRQVYADVDGLAKIVTKTASATGGTDGSPLAARQAHPPPPLK